MARRYINTSQYNPYSFQEMWQPALAATQAHQQQMGAMAEMNAKSNLIGNYIDPQKDPEEYAAWQQYNNSIKQASQDLLSRGLSTNTYNNVYGLTVDYQQNIKPIETSIENQQSFAKLQSDAKMKNPKMFFAKTASDYSLKDFRNGLPQMDLVDGDEAQKQAVLMANAYANGHLEMLPPQAYSKFKMLVETAVVDPTTGQRLSFENALAQLNSQNPNALMNIMKRTVMETVGGNRLRDNNKMNDYAQLNGLIDNALMGAIIQKPDFKLEDNGYAQEQSIAQGWAKIAQDERHFQTQMAAKQAAAAAEEQKAATHFAYRTDRDANGNAYVMPYFTPAGGQEKNYAAAIQNRLQGAAASKNGRKGKYAVNITDAKGKPVTLPKDWGTKAHSFSIEVPGILNKQKTTKIGLRIDGKIYYCQPEDLGIHPDIIKAYEGQLHLPMYDKLISSPQYLTKEEVVAINQTREAMLDHIARELNDLAKYTPQDNYKDLE